MDELDPKDLQPQTMLGMKLIQQPFTKLPEAENLFDFDALKQTRDTVSHHLQFSHLLMVIQGKKGSGKNSLANSLIIGEHPALYYFNATVEAGDDLNALLNKAADNNHADNIEVLEKRIHDIMYRGQQPVLIINDAENLSEDELHKLLNYVRQHNDQNQQTKLKLLLLGTPALEKNLERNNVVNHNQFYLIELPLLNVSNTLSFLMHRLHQAGYKGDSPFSDNEISNIFNMANGNPVATMEYAAESLNKNKQFNEYDASNKATKSKPLIFIAAALFIAAIIYNSVLTGPDEGDKQTTNLPLDIEKKAVHEIFKPATNTMDIKQREHGSDITKLVPDFAMPGQTPDLESGHPIDSMPDISHILKPTNPVTDKPVVAKPGTAETVKPANTAKGTKQPDPVKGPAVVTSSVKTEIKNTTKPLPKPEIKQDKVITTTASQKQYKQTTSRQQADTVTQAFIKAGARSPEWLLKQPADSWGLQILAGHEAETLLSYIQQHKLGSKVAYFRSQLGNKDWHVILYGNYKSKEQAKGVIPYLPSHIQRNRPWPKDLKSVQNAIKQYRK